VLSVPTHPFSYFEMEQAEYAKRGVMLSVEAWLVKLMVSGSTGRKGGLQVSSCCSLLLYSQPGLRVCDTAWTLC
jgi:hypothetical protein